MRLAVIGRGLIGAAAARHLALLGHEVALIGPDEPADPGRHDGVFGSHYDEGRITRVLETHPFWRRANAASIARYADIAAESGVDFYHEAGALHLGPDDGGEVAELAAIAAAEGIACETMDSDGLRARFPFLGIRPGMRGCFEPRNAGHISPRRLVRAQTTAARRAGARVVAEAAVAISESGSGVTIRTRSGDVEAERALVAAGGHTPSLLGRVGGRAEGGSAARALGLTVYARTVALFRLGPAEAARLSGMPSMRCFGPPGDAPYILPPIVYPDGRHWLKLGGDPVDRTLDGEAAIGDWFRSGGSVPVADALERQIRERLPGLAVEERRVMPCMTTFSRTGLPVIGPLSQRLAIATGGCGKAAKCSDELGRLAALALLGEVQAELAP